MSDLVLHTNIVAILNEDAALDALLDGRISPSEASNNSSELAYLIYDQISGNDDKTHDGDADTPEAVIEFKIFAPSARNRFEVADALKAALRAAEGVLRAGFFLSSVTQEYAFDGTETVTRESGGKRSLFRRLVNYRVKWQVR